MTDTATPPPPADKAGLDEFLDAPQEKPWRRYAIIGGTILLLAAIVLLLARCFGGSDEGGYATSPVRRGDLTVTVSATGNLAPTNQVEVGSEQSGLVTQVFADNNDRVTKGQPLARLDTSRLLDAVTQARASLASAQAQVAQAEATRVQAQANLSRLEEVARLSGGKVPSKVELESGRAEAQRAAASVNAAKAAVAQARAQLSSSETNLSKATIYSPVNGVVLSRQVDPGQTVAASLNAPVLFVIAEDLGRMKLEVKVDEADVGQVKEGQRATFTVDAFPGRSFPATIQRVDVGANATQQTTSTGTSSSSSSSSGSNVIAYTAVLTVANDDLQLRPGMTATADIVTVEKTNVMTVPNAALRFSPDQVGGGSQKAGGVTSVLVPRRGGRRGNRGDREVTIGRGSRQTVYVVAADGQPQPIEVIVGETDGARTEVSGEGLRPGLQVITAKLAAGQTSRSSDSSGERATRGGGRGNGGDAGQAAESKGGEQGGGGQDGRGGSGGEGGGGQAQGDQRGGRRGGGGGG